MTIAIALYKPNLKWLKEQLISLNNQNYKNIDLLAWDDCSANDVDYKKFFSKYITNFKFKIYYGEVNIGSNKVFEQLTVLSDGEYIAYCDQDDIWLPEKISILVQKIQKTNANLICSDMFVIDKNSNIIANKITQIRPHQKFFWGSNLFEYLFSKNFITGTTMLVRKSFAKNALPFPDEYVHDWWLALCAAAVNKLQICDKSLIKYRIHDFNQTRILQGIYSKEDYYEKRIKLVIKRSWILKKRFGKLDSVDKFNIYAESRLSYYNERNLKTFYKLFINRKFNKLTTYFELMLPIIPDFLFKFIIKQIRKGRI